MLLQLDWCWKNLGTQAGFEPMTSRLCIRCLSSLVLHPTTQLEVEKLITNLPNKSSSEHDKVSNNLLKKLCSSISYSLMIIFNQSISKRIFLDIMKIAKVIPLYNGKETDKVVNYCQISLLITISKVLEKIVNTRVYNFLEENGVLYKSQYGFRNKKSCEQTITELQGHILQAREQGHSSASIFLDLSKAFNTLNHTVLLKKAQLLWHQRPDKELVQKLSQ